VRLLRTVAILALTLGAGLFGAGLFVACGSESAMDDPPPTGADPAQGSTRVATTPTPTDTATPSPTPTATPTPYDGLVARMRIPRFGVDAPVEAIGLLPTNQLDVPKDPLNVGWYYIYDKPGWGGNAVFSAHVDYWPNIRGPFYNLKDLEPGDQVVVVMEDGTEYVYEVFRKERYHVSNIPMGELIDAPEKPDGEEWITIITCGGEFRASRPGGPGEYLERDVVVAKRIQ